MDDLYQYDSSFLDEVDAIANSSNAEYWNELDACELANRISNPTFDFTYYATKSDRRFLLSALVILRRLSRLIALAVVFDFSGA